VLNPRNIEALVGMASVDTQVAGAFITDDRAARLAVAETTLMKALSDAPNHALAHMQLGCVQMYTNRAAQGIAQCERALVLDRNLADAHGFVGLGKYFVGRGAETEAHICEAIRLSPRDIFAYRWLLFVGFAKFQLSKDAEAASWLLRSIEANRNYPIAHTSLAAALALLGSLDQARAAAKTGLALDPSFTIRRFRDGASTDDPTYLAGRERICEGMRLAGVPEG
jgi:tetratricopeptide (TPR) repeat protein